MSSQDKLAQALRHIAGAAMDITCERTAIRSAALQALADHEAEGDGSPDQAALAQLAVPARRIVVTEAMHVAACKVLLRAHGLDGLPQRMLDAMLAAAPAAPECTRSHPHEDMGAGCRRKTEEARATSAARNASQSPAGGMPSGWVIRDRGDLDPGWIDIQGPGLQRLNLSAKHGSPEWRTLYALASALLAQAPAVGAVIWTDAAIMSLMNRVGDGPYGEDDVRVTRRFMEIAEEIRAELVECQPTAQPNGEPKAAPQAEQQAVPEGHAAVPLTEEQAKRICYVGPVYAPNGKVERSPSAYRMELEEARLYGIREAERAHGIGKEG